VCVCVCSLVLCCIRYIIDVFTRFLLGRGGGWGGVAYLEEPEGLGQGPDLLLDGEDAGEHLAVVGLLLQVHGAPPLLRGARDRERERELKSLHYRSPIIVPPGVSVISHREPFHNWPCGYRRVTSQVGMST